MIMNGSPKYSYVKLVVLDIQLVYFIVNDF